MLKLYILYVWLKKEEKFKKRLYCDININWYLLRDYDMVICYSIKFVVWISGILYMCIVILFRLWWGFIVLNINCIGCFEREDVFRGDWSKEEDFIKWNIFMFGLLKFIYRNFGWGFELIERNC